MGVPAVTRVADAVRRIPSGQELLVDGSAGTVVAAPSPAARAAFEERRRKGEVRTQRLKKRCFEPAFTRDGVEVKVMANISCLEDSRLAVENGMDGIGLYRMENIYLGRKTPPSEDELFDILSRSLEPVNDKPVFIRLLDLGGDKNLPFLDLPDEPNPFLGRRGVRILLDFPNLLNTQLRVLLRLSAERDVRIMIPMVTLASEVGRMRTLLRSAAREMGAVGVPALGAMVETPAAALGAARLAKHCDFLSLGTNDLTQYTMAAGRENASVADYFMENHSSVLRLLNICVRDVQGVSLSVCGELAAREEMIPYFAKIGVRTLSVPPTAVPAVKETIRATETIPQEDSYEWSEVPSRNLERGGSHGAEPMLTA
jgi:phosphoenolpyruvate-protein kinase (PTS system EI component)